MQITDFWKLVEKTETCWLWPADKLVNGYGYLYLDGDKKRHKAHRIAYVLTYLHLQKHECVLHICDNPRCVRPDHLRVGSHKDNTEDAKRKGRLATGSRHGSRTHPERLARGENNTSTKLTVEQVKEIKIALAKGKSQSSLAREYGVSRGAIEGIVRGKSWVYIS